MHRSITVLALATLVLVGCARAGDWAGTWQGQLDIPNPVGMNPAVAETLKTVTVKILPDGHFVLTEASFEKRGSATLGPDSATLIIDEVMGRPAGANEAMAGERKLRLNKDGTATIQLPTGESVILTRLSR